MKRHLTRVALALAVVAGLAVHIGLGYQAGLVVALLGLAGHVLLGVAAQKTWRSRKPDSPTPESTPAEP
ncbi:hypothetical protein [Saccharothrix variisporea]|uniref:Uncharacterized protein n=1 Tax=Saccharothrix variisporea TaxID=543527 RepID=A0A495X5V7_9PSEU|nr:hypothetical protein [Saccharothrix variisporea]RKT66928.1 hypothetical protein DFJ66_0094 [Saccharothrix variisporea]